MKTKALFVTVTLTATTLLSACVVEPARPPAPAPRVEVPPPAPAPGYRWVKGHYRWERNHWAWIGGHWVAAY
jgi:hypothetical protein